DRDAGRPEGECPDVYAGRAGGSGSRARYRGLTRHRRIRDHVVLRVVGLVTLEARLVVGLVVELAVRAEDRVLPLAVADVVGILGAPAGALFHDRVGDEIALHEAPLGVLDRVALGVDLRLVLHQGENGAAGQGLAFLGRLARGRARVQLPVLLDVVPVGDGVEDIVLEPGWERDLFRARAAAGGHDREGGYDEGYDDERQGPCAHPISSVPRSAGRVRVWRESTGPGANPSSQPCQFTRAGRGRSRTGWAAGRRGCARPATRRPHGPGLRVGGPWG